MTMRTELYRLSSLLDVIVRRVTTQGCLGTKKAYPSQDTPRIPSTPTLLGRFFDHNWKRPSGYPQNNWLDQMVSDTNCCLAR